MCPMKSDKDASRVHQAWQQYCASFEESLRELERTPRFQDNVHDRKQAYIALLQAQAMAYNWVVAPRPEVARVYTHTAWNTNVYTLGGNGSDDCLAIAFLDGRATYRLRGRLGQLRLITLQHFSHALGHPDARMLGNYEWTPDDLAADGRLDLIFSASKQDGNWIRLDGQSQHNFLFFRRKLGDWFDDLGALDVETLSPPPASGNDSECVVERIDAARGFYKYLIEKWAIGIYDVFRAKAGGRPNSVSYFPGKDIAQGYAGSPSTDYAGIVYEIQADEAMIIELERPDAAYWSIQLFDVWSKSLDFMNYQTDVNLLRAVVDADDKLRCVISHSDPGLANWLDCRGQSTGFAVFRNYRARTQPVPVVRIVKLSELKQALPPETARVTPAERAKALTYRQLGLRRLYDLPGASQRPE